MNAMSGLWSHSLIQYNNVRYNTNNPMTKHTKANVKFISASMMFFSNMHSMQEKIGQQDR